MTQRVMEPASFTLDDLTSILGIPMTERKNWLHRIVLWHTQGHTQNKLINSLKKISLIRDCSSMISVHRWQKQEDHPWIAVEVTGHAELHKVTLSQNKPNSCSGLTHWAVDIPYSTHMRVHTGRTTIINPPHTARNPCWAPYLTAQSTIIPILYCLQISFP